MLVNAREKEPKERNGCLAVTMLGSPRENLDHHFGRLRSMSSTINTIFILWQFDRYFGETSFYIITSFMI